MYVALSGYGVTGHVGLPEHMDVCKCTVWVCLGTCAALGLEWQRYTCGYECLYTSVVVCVCVSLYMYAFSLCVSVFLCCVLCMLCVLCGSLYTDNCFILVCVCICVVCACGSLLYRAYLLGKRPPWTVPRTRLSVLPRELSSRQGGRCVQIQPLVGLAGVKNSEKEPGDPVCSGW